jgi:hypothetical protein
MALGEHKKTASPISKTAAIIQPSSICGAGAQNIVIGQEVYTATVSAVSLRPKFSFGREGVAYP